ncbi:MAG: hypothetical protein J0H01_34530 [Rhizobiales bacterium]|nr:hypothetical protein [Hyphomicrobiales bacterium]
MKFIGFESNPPRNPKVATEYSWAAASVALAEVVPLRSQPARAKLTAMECRMNSPDLDRESANSLGDDQSFIANSW